MSEEKSRPSIRWNKTIEGWARQLMTEDGFDSVQDLLIQLVRDEWRRRHPASSPQEVQDLVETIGKKAKSFSEALGQEAPKAKGHKRID